MLVENDVSDPGREPGSTRTTGSITASELRKTGAFGDKTEPIVELGYHEDAGTDQMDLLLPVHHHRCVQSLCGGLDDCRTGIVQSGSKQDARIWAKEFFRWYNYQHHHSGLGLLTPAVVHDGQAQQVREKRQLTLQKAFALHPERFVRGLPKPHPLPEAVWINPPLNVKRISTEPLHKQSALSEGGVPVKGAVPQGCAAQHP